MRLLVYGYTHLNIVSCFNKCTLLYKRGKYLDITVDGVLARPNMLKYFVLLVAASVLIQISVAQDGVDVVESSDVEESESSLNSESSSLVKPKCGTPRPKCTKKNEQLEICPPPCPFKTCGIDDTLIDCAPAPVPGDPDCPPPACRCKSQFFRDDKGNCVPWDKCPVCPANEQYDPCDTPCPLRKCDVDPRVIKCAASPKLGDKDCVVGCRCIDGYARDKKGVCVPREQCPGYCPANEQYDPCDTPCPLRRCDVDLTLIKCALPPKPGDELCVAGCRCIDGYARDANGVCIPRKQCPPKVPNCGTNEVYDKCPDCSPQTCETMNAIYHCPLRPANNTGPGCKPSCRCKKGYYRNKIGQCISAEKCSRCTGSHEYYSCGGACDNVCDTIKEQNQTNCPIINVKCNEMCYCEEGYARDYKGECIPIKDCPVCPTNERYDPCPETLCGPKTCDEAGFPKNCTPREDGASCPGKPGCVCRDGYLRDENGRCIQSNECPSCGGDKNATLGCGVNCNRHCSNVNQTEPKACILICYSNACDCRSDINGRDYYYDDNLKKCVLPEDCTPQCKQNEVFSDCINGGCGKQKCSDINKPVVCVHPKVCKSGCICAPGYLRAKNGTCVLSEKCDPPPKCKANEEFSKCGRDGCLKHYCSDLDTPPLCRDTFQCIPQCECKEGFLRASFDNDTCVPIEKCPRKCKKNEYLSECPAGTCQPKTCKEAGFPIPCPTVGPGVGPCSSGPGCLCNPGYLRNDKGICIPQQECPSCGGDDNAVPGCGGNCGNTCTTYNRTDIVCTLICKLNGCDCKKGYVYDGNVKKCVLPKNCSPTCQVNEEYSTCANGRCGQNCADKGKIVHCPLISDDTCTAGCVCKNGYLRAQNGTCVLENQCEEQTSCGGDENAVPGCGVHCGNTCDTYNRTDPIVCPLICNLNGCDCKPGYVFDGNLNKCVLPEKCTPTCKVNEVFSTCANSACGQSCADKDKILNCPLISDDTCTPGCICQKGYLRAQNGTCVPEDQCEQTCPEGEILSTCPPIKCDAEYCPKSRNSSLTCPIPKKCPSPRCVCGFNRHRDRKTGKCIATAQCPPFPCDGPNEKYQSCPPVCPGETCTDYLKNATCPKFRIGIVVPCKPACRCLKGYYRNSQGICISKNKCKEQTCKVNEEYSTCINGLCRPQKCVDKDITITCPKYDKTTCKGGCVCKKSFLRAKNGTCIPQDQCDESC